MKGLLAWLFALLIVSGVFRENRAWGFFAQPESAPGQIEAVGPEAVGDFYDASRYDAPGYALAPKNAGNLFSYTRRPGGFSGDTFKVGAAGRAWTTKHAPGAWAFDGGVKNALTRAWRTGQFTRFSYVKKIPDAARPLFSPVRAFGPARGWKRLGGQHFTRTPGNVNLATGQVLNPTLWQRARFVGDAAIYHGVDITVTGSAIGLGGYGIYSLFSDE